MTNLRHNAEQLIDRLDAFPPADGHEERIFQRERGWVEAVKHLLERRMLTPEGIEEAGKILAASNDWADGLQAEEDKLVMPSAVVVGG